MKLNKLKNKEKMFFSFRIVAIDSRRPREGIALEYLGYFNPIARPSEVSLDASNIKKWLGVGAQPSFPLKRLLVKANLVQVED